MQVVFVKLMPAAAAELPDNPNNYEAVPYFDVRTSCSHVHSACEWCLVNSWEEHDFLSKVPTEVSLVMPGSLPAQHPANE